MAHYPHNPQPATLARVAIARLQQRKNASASTVNARASYRLHDFAKKLTLAGNSS
jgi:hypothetical protein